MPPPPGLADPSQLSDADLARAMSAAQGPAPPAPQPPAAQPAGAPPLADPSQLSDADLRRAMVQPPGGASAGPLGHALLARAGQRCDGEQCGQAVSDALSGLGVGQTATSLRNRAMSNPALQVQSDAQGNYPNDTILYFRPTNGITDGKGTNQHFGVVYTGADGVQRLAESTSAGQPSGERQYRADRPVSQIAAAHGGNLLAFRAPGLAAQGISSGPALSSPSPPDSSSQRFADPSQLSDADLQKAVSGSGASASAQSPAAPTSGQPSAPAPGVPPGPMVPTLSPVEQARNTFNLSVDAYAAKYKAGTVTGADVETQRNAMKQYLHDQPPGEYDRAAFLEPILVNQWLSPREVSDAQYNPDAHANANNETDLDNAFNMMGAPLAQKDELGNLQPGFVPKFLQGLGSAALGGARQAQDMAVGDKAAFARDTADAQRGSDLVSDTANAMLPGTAQDLLSGRGAQIPGNYLREATQHPLNFGVNAASAILTGLHGAGALRGAAEMRAAPSEAPPAQAHPTAPGENGAARAVDGKFVEPSAVQPPATPPAAAPPAPLPGAADAGRAALLQGHVDSANSLLSSPHLDPDLRGAVTQARDIAQRGLDRAHAAPAAPPADVTPLRPASTPPAPVEAPPAPVEAPPAPVEAPPPADTPKPKPTMAGSINLDNLATTPEAKARITAAAEKMAKGDPLTHDETRQAAQALALTPAHLAQIPPGEVPSGVHPAVFQAAVRGLHVAAAEKAEAAHGANLAAPTPATGAAVTSAEAGLVAVGTHAQALARRSGQTLASLNMDSSAWETAQEKAGSTQQALAQTPKLADPSAPAKAPKAAGFGSGNKVFTTADRDAALARISAAGSRVNSGIDPALFKDAVIVAGHYIEGGVRQFGPLAAQMRTHFPQATDGDLQRVYATAKADAAAGTTQKQRQTAQSVFADRLTPSMGRQGVSAFVNALPAGHLDKLLSGAPLTDAEARTVAAARQANTVSRGPSAPLQSVKDLQAIVRDARAGKLGYDSAKSAVREELVKALPPEKMGAVARDLAGVKDDDFHALANVYNRHAPAGLVDKIKTVQQASLLSGPKTLGGIAAAHTLGASFEDLAVRPLAAALSGGTVQGLNLRATGAAVKAGVRALPEGAQMIRQGPTAMQLRGVHGGLRLEEAGGGHHLHGEPVQSPLVRAPGRVHAALYHVVGAALEERGIQEASALKARAQGGKPEQYRADPDVKQKAREYRAEQLYQNKNKASDMIGGAAAQGGAAGRLAVNTLLPFRNVPMNLAGRGLEYSGLGLPVAGARLTKAKIAGEAVTPELRRSLAFQAARGIAGPALGVGAGALLTAAGVLTPPDEKAHESGSVNAGRLKFDISRLQPVSTAIMEGGELYNALHHRPANALAPLADNPYLNVGQQIQDVRDGASGKTKGLTRVVGSLVGELSPTLLSQIAAATDPSGDVRKKQSAWDYLFNRVPGLRERLPAGTYPQPSNYRSTGPASLLYPGNVAPRGPEAGLRPARGRAEGRRSW